MSKIKNPVGRPSDEYLCTGGIHQRSPDTDERPALDSKFEGREGVLYTVHGKGDLVREVLLPEHLAQRLEETRLKAPRAITNRNIHYL